MLDSSRKQAPPTTATVLGRGTPEAPRRVFWTGGWDSTFIVLEAAIVHGHTVQPIYVLSEDRGSRPHERHAIETIRAALEARFPTEIHERVMPLETVNRTDVPPAPHAAAAYDRLIKTHRMGIQYRWLAEYAASGEGPLEVGMHWRIHLDRGHGAWLMEHSHRVDGVYAMREDIDWEDYRTVLGRYVFPILQYMKPQMLRVAQEYGFDDLMRLTHSCHHPDARGRACGMCVPCRGAIEENDAFGIPLHNRAKSAIWTALRRVKRRVLGAR